MTELAGRWLMGNATCLIVVHTWKIALSAGAVFWAGSLYWASSIDEPRLVKWIVERWMDWRMKGCDCLGCSIFRVGWLKCFLVCLNVITPIFNIEFRDEILLTSI
ncbi:hypothetical protein Droror1_Dr00025853 [Drosera rotundifolia]